MENEPQEDKSATNRPEREKDSDEKPSPEELRRRIEALSGHFEPTPKRGGWLNLFGCLGCVGKALAFLSIPVLVLSLIWWWHPWHTETVPVSDIQCPEGQVGEGSVEYLVVFGSRVSQSGSTVICVDE